MWTLLFVLVSLFPCCIAFITGRHVCNAGTLSSSSSIRLVRGDGSSVVEPRALNLEFSADNIRLTTGVYPFAWRNGGGSQTQAQAQAQVDLFSMLHIADTAYFAEISTRMKDYDVVLYELITDTRNCLMQEGKDYKRQLDKEIYSSEAARLASSFDLDTQINLYNSIVWKESCAYCANWYIADLDAVEVARLEAPRRGLTLSSFHSSRLAGRAWQEQLLKSFFLPDTAIITTLRQMSWLGPCPELSCLLLDWSRWSNPTKAGGLPFAIVPITQYLLRFKWNAAKKLAFAQQLISGMPDAGAWGGEALSDIEIRVRARNAECCRVLMHFLEEHSEQVSSSQRELGQGSPVVAPLKVAILYGAYHIDDLRTKLQTMGLKRLQKAAGTCDASKLTAWTMAGPSPSTSTSSQLSALADSPPLALSDSPLRASSLSTTAVESPVDVTNSSPSIADLFTTDTSVTITTALACLAYLFLGALDWFLLLDFVVDTLRHLVGEVWSTAGSTTTTTGMGGQEPQAHVSIVASVLHQAFGMGSDSDGSFTDDDRLFELSAVVLYSLAYVQRHLSALRTVSSVGVQWDRGLFDDDGQTANNT
jgi:hypothetical protein